MDISFVCVNWNTRDLLIDCIRSIEEDASGSAVEIIVVDNASSDDSVAAVSERFPGVTVIQNQANVGFAKANNIGIQASRGDYVCLVNSDIKVLPGCIPSLHRYIDDHPGIGIIGPRLLNSDLSLQWSCKRFPTLWNNLCNTLGFNKAFPGSRLLCGVHMSYFPHDRIFKSQALVGAFLMIRRRALADVGLLDERFFMYSEEVDLCMRLSRAGWDIVFYPEAQAIHHGRGSSSREPERFYTQLYRSERLFWKKHYGRLRYLGFIWISVLRQFIRISANLLSFAARPATRRRSASKIRESLAVVRLLLTPAGHAA